MRSSRRRFERTQAVAEGAPDNAPALLHLNMASRQERGLWRHVATIEDVRESLNEIEPGVISRLAQIAAERRWEIILGIWESGSPRCRS